MQRHLVQRAQAGDHDAFSVLAGGSIARLYALVSAWRDVRGLRDPDAWDAWLHRLTVRACYRWARKERRRDLVELHVMPDPEPAIAFDLSMSVVERDRMERELGRLAIDQRAVIVLHFYIGMPLTEAAQILDIPVGTAKSRLHRGLLSLRDSMRGDPEADPEQTREASA